MIRRILLSLAVLVCFGGFGTVAEAAVPKSYDTIRAQQNARIGGRYGVPKSWGTMDAQYNARIGARYGIPKSYGTWEAQRWSRFGGR